MVAAASVYFVWVYGRNGDLELTLARLRGDTLIIAEPTVNFGEMDGGEEKEVAFTIRNLSNRSWRIIGAVDNVVKVHGLPIEIPPEAKAHSSSRHFKVAATLGPSRQDGD